MKPWPALAADLTCLLVFAIVGRTSHGEAADLTGVAITVWPFLAGYLLGLVAARGWRTPFALRTAVAVWLGALVGGMALRALTGAGTPVSFVVVAGIVLALLLLGWRGLHALVRRARRG